MQMYILGLFLSLAVVGVSVVTRLRYVPKSGMDRLYGSPIFSFAFFFLI